MTVYFVMIIIEHRFPLHLVELNLTFVTFPPLDVSLIRIQLLCLSDSRSIGCLLSVEPRILN